MIHIQVKHTIAEHNLLQTGQHVLVCVSGGADSIALLFILKDISAQLGIRLTCAHFNHQLRGKAAEEDLRYVQKVARQLGIKVVTGTKDVRAKAISCGESLEMAARQARYDFFARTAHACKCQVAATAHTIDDQAETILLKLARGSGMHGLCGIPYTGMWKRLKIIRPMRDIRKKEIINFLRKKQIPWREDTSNDSTAFLRNRVRHIVLPYFREKINPQIGQNLCRLGSIIEKDNEWLNKLAKKILLSCQLSQKARYRKTKSSLESRKLLLRAPLLQYPLAAQRRVLRLWLETCGVPQNKIDFKATERVVTLLSSNKSGQMVTLAGNWLVVHQYDRLIAKRTEAEKPEPYCFSVKIPGETLLPEQGFRITASLKPGIVHKKKSHIGRFPAQTLLSVTEWRRRKIKVRSWQHGDRIAPLGLNGTKKIQDIFVDNKVPKALRNHIPLFECSNTLIWLPGYCIAHGWEVKDNSKEALQLFVEQI